MLEIDKRFGGIEGKGHIFAGAEEALAIGWAPDLSLRDDTGVKPFNVDAKVSWSGSKHETQVFELSRGIVS